MEKVEPLEKRTTEKAWARIIWLVLSMHPQPTSEEKLDPSIFGKSFL